MTNKRILFFHETFPAGGAERVTLDIASYVSTYGYEVYVLTRKLKSGNVDSLKTIEVPNSCIKDDQVDASYITSVIKKYSIDVYVLPVCTYYNQLKYLKDNTSCKLVFSLHSVPLWEITYSLYEKKQRCESSFSRLLLWHLIVYPKTKWFKRYHARTINVHKKVYEVVDRYTVLCDDYRTSLLRQMELPLTEEKMHAIHNAEIPPSSVNLDKKKQILFVGRLNYVDKRVDRLLDIWSMIFRKAPDWEVVLVGDGPERAALEHKVAQKQIDRIRFVGHSENVSDYYQTASILCLTSTFEGWPLCLTEAQSYGVVPLAFDCTAGVHDVLSPSGVNGFLIEPFRKRKYARTLLKLINNPKQLEAMRLNVIRKSAEYSSEVAKDKWLKLFNSLCR